MVLSCRTTSSASVALQRKANIRIGIMSIDLALCNKPNSGQIAPWFNRCLYLIPVTQAENPGDQDCCSTAGAVRREHTWDSHANRDHAAEAADKFSPG